MKTKLVDTVVGNEEYVRLRIFDGEFTPDNAYEELLRIEKEQRKSDRFFYEERIDYLNNLLRTFSPNKGKNMNVTPTTNTVDETFVNFYIDAEGNRVEIPFDLDVEGENNGRTYSGDSEAAQQETAFIAEDGADHPVTVH